MINKLVQFIQNNFDPQQDVRADSTLESLGLNSYQLIEIIVFIEEEWNIETDLQQMNLQAGSKLQDIVDFIEKNQIS